ncbi:unnamed protein product [Merluccius merluccius]
MLTTFRRDIKERFTNYVLLLIVCLRNMEQFSWNPEHLWVLCPDVVMVITSEVAVDIIKHAFITKFNDITADVYSEYRASLAFELVSSRQKNAYTDYSDSVARRMGFIPLPLAVLLVRVVMSSLKVQGALAYSCVLLCYLGLVSLKVLNSIVLLGKSCVYVRRANMEEKLFDRPAPPRKTPSRADQETSPAPSGVEKTPAAPCRATSTSPCSPPSVTTQPFPRTDLLPSPPPSSTSSSITATITSTPVPPAPAPSPAPDPPTRLPSAGSRPPAPPPPPDPEAPPPTPAGQEGEEPEPPQGGSELKHRGAKKDLLEIDRFTICGNRID